MKESTQQNKKFAQTAQESRYVVVANLYPSSKKIIAVAMLVNELITITPVFEKKSDKQCPDNSF